MAIIWHPFPADPAVALKEGIQVRRMRITGIREQSIGISRYRDQRMPSGGLTTSLVAVVTDVVRGGQPVTGYGFASVGRYAQSGLIRERFAPRLLQAPAPDAERAHDLDQRGAVLGDLRRDGAQDSRGLRSRVGRGRHAPGQPDAAGRAGQVVV
jgi:hypothetical protein